MAKRVLVVDNDFFFVEFLTELLENKGYEVVKAYDGKEGISRLEQSVYDILIADLIMPKIDGVQLIKFARGKHPPGRLTIIAISGTLVEQMEDVQDIGADYCIVKGPLEAMTGYVGEVLDNIKNQPENDSEHSRIVDPGTLYPRQTTAELVDELNFQKAVFDCIGVGILVVDRDAHVMSANAMALVLLKKPLEDVLNLRITDVFPRESRARLVKALKEVAKNLHLKHHRFYLASDSEKLKMVVSMLRMGTDLDGWILTMEELDI